MKVPYALSIASIFTLVYSSPIQNSFTPGQEVVTTSGTLFGHAAANRTGVSEYLGVPFAQPPLDDLRFAAPQPFVSTANFNASNFGLECLDFTAPINFSILTAEGYHVTPQGEETLDIIAEANGIPHGEDCLKLNVWTKPQTGEKTKAVLFFIHGGGFQGGGTSNKFLNGQFLADEEDVVVISANYRTNVFGFPGPQPGASANAGLLDQRLAIEWARDNVASFGGDPTRITLFGQSAGSASISMYDYAYATDPIVNGLITESGTADSFGVAPPNTAAAWASLSTTLGCANTSSAAATLACVRSKPAPAVLSAMLQVPLTAQVSSLGAFVPTADNTTVFSNYTLLTSTHHFAPLPRLLGSNAQEGGTFELSEALAGLVLPPVFWEFFTAVIFTCPTSSAASAFAQNQQQGVWRYVFDGDYPNTRLTVNPSVGAYHGAELPLLFDTTTVLGQPDTKAEARMARYMRRAWAGFAKNPASGLAKALFKWPAIPSNSNATETAQTVHLGLANATTAVFLPASQDDGVCGQIVPVVTQLGGPAGVSAVVLAGGPGLVQTLDGIKDGDLVGVAQALLEAAEMEGGGGAGSKRK